MKTNYRFYIAFFAMLLLFNTSIFSQEEEQKRPQYVVVTTLHWNMDLEDFDMEEWKATEKEYLDKVIRKNEHIVGAAYYMHRFTPDNTELLFVRTFNSWADIDAAGARNGELSKEAWPDNEEAKAFYTKKNNYYAEHHSDEIYATMEGAKLMAAPPTKDMILYIQKGHFAPWPEDGSGEEYEAGTKLRREKIIGKNEFIKAYYPSGHAWGADNTEFVEAYVLDSMDDLDDMLKRNGELAKEFTDEEKALDEKMWKYFTGKHGDYIYTYIHM